MRKLGQHGNKTDNKYLDSWLNIVEKNDENKRHKKQRRKSRFNLVNELNIRWAGGQTATDSEREREMASGVHGPLVVAGRAPGAGNNNISPRH